MDQTDEQVRLLGEDGTLLQHDTYKVDLTDEDLCDLYRQLVVVRRIDARPSTSSVRASSASARRCLGQEAAQVGGAYALRTGRLDLPVLPRAGRRLVRAGMEVLSVLGLYRGATCPAATPSATSWLLYSIPIGTQALHAAGFAIGRQAGRRRRSCDVATSATARPARATRTRP